MIRSSDTHEEGTADDLLDVLKAHLQSLVSARSDETLIRQYSELLRFLRSQPRGFLDRPVHLKGHSARPRLTSGLNDEDLTTASLVEVERLVEDAATPRVDLEVIAMRRFGVPSGSMRSFSNKQMLLDKLRSLIRNERAHSTIGALARGEKQTSEA
jgi:hypothetical protein